MTIKIGFEIHVQLNTKQKLFCECSSEYRDKEPNTNICPICTGQPGSKPMPPNKKAIENILKIGYLLGCKLTSKNKILFLRKHYFYPDLPKGYQITSEPIMENGLFFGVRIREIHLEEDPGRYDLRNGYVDYNRSGVALAEIVTEPDIKSPKEAKDWLDKLFMYLKYTGAIKEDPGSIRIDLNISLEGGERVEVKNINSIEGVYRAINYEILRQTRALSIGKKIKRETRHFDEEKKITVPLREKETVADYRYIPDPDLLPLKIEVSLMNKIKEEIIPPKELEYILKTKYNIKDNYVEVLLSDVEYATKSIELFKKINNDYNILVEFIINYLRRYLKTKGMKISEIDFNPIYAIELLKKIKNEEISKKYIDELIEIIIRGGDPIKYAKEKGYIINKETFSEDILDKIIEDVLKEESKAVSDYLSGNPKAINRLIGKVLIKTNRQVSSKIVLEKIKRKIENLKA